MKTLISLASLLGLTALSALSAQAEETWPTITGQMSCGSMAKIVDAANSVKPEGVAHLIYQPICNVSRMHRYGSTFSVCIKYKVPHKTKLELSITADSVNNSPGDSCSHGYCGTSPGLGVFSSLDGANWRRVAGLMGKNSADNKGITNKIVEMPELYNEFMVCRGGGGPARNNIALKSVYQPCAVPECASGKLHPKTYRCVPEEIVSHPNKYYFTDTAACLPSFEGAQEHCTELPALSSCFSEQTIALNLPIREIPLDANVANSALGIVGQAGSFSDLNELSRQCYQETVTKMKATVADSADKNEVVDQEFLKNLNATLKTAKGCLANAEDKMQDIASETDDSAASELNATISDSDLVDEFSASETGSSSDENRIEFAQSGSSKYATAAASSDAAGKSGGVAPAGLGADAQNQDAEGKSSGVLSANLKESIKYGSRNVVKTGGQNNLRTFAKKGANQQTTKLNRRRRESRKTNSARSIFDMVGIQYDKRTDAMLTLAWRLKVNEQTKEQSEFERVLNR